MRVLSLFDGMACGMLAMMAAGVEVENYDAYEIDKYAIKTATHNFPMIEQHGDVFAEDFTKYDGVDFLVGGSPCTYWSIAQTKNRETVASGLGWELFSQYVRALHEAKPKYFIYENNKSMSKEIRASIDKAFGFEAVCINSALVSAQNRQRLYWVGKRNADGTYSKVYVEQPEDRGILLKDVLDGVTWRDKSCTLRASAGTIQGTSNILRHIETNGQFGYMGVAEPVNANEDGKAFCVTSRYYKGFGENPGRCIEKHRDSMAAEPVAGMYALPVEEPMRVREATKAGEAQIEMGACVDMTQPNSKTRRGRSMDEKSNCLVTSPQYYQYCAKLCYAVPCEWDENGYPVKAVSCSDGKVYPVYKVENGEITIKDKQYPIKLVDGYYIIRKLTVSECMRLQTVPEWYDFSCVSNSQAYKMLGNGWTVEVIAHLIRSALTITGGNL